MYDIAIIGLGPAGATLARLLDSRFKVIALDTKIRDGQTGFHKPCGGLLAPDAQKALARFGLALPLGILVNPQIFSVRTIDVPRGLVRHYQRHYINMDRHRFDLWLKAIIPPHVETHHEARVNDISRINGGFTVTWRENDREHSANARRVIGADGAASLLRRRLYSKAPLRQYVAIQQWFNDSHAAPFYSCIFDESITDCYAWGVTKNEAFVFGGAFYPQQARKAFEALKLKMRPFGFKLDSPVKTEACLVLRPKPFQVYTGCNNAFLLGEAAGFISPSSLEGLSYAMDSARILSEVLNYDASNPNKTYMRRTLPIKMALWGKNLKSPFIYRPGLRNLILRSGVSAINVMDADFTGN